MSVFRVAGRIVQGAMFVFLPAFMLSIWTWSTLSRGGVERNGLAWHVADAAAAYIVWLPLVLLGATVHFLLCIVVMRTSRVETARLTVVTAPIVPLVMFGVVSAGAREAPGARIETLALILGIVAFPTALYMVFLATGHRRAAERESGKREA